MAGIRKKTYKNKKGVEITKYYIVYKDINGKQCSGGSYDTKREAKEHLSEYNEVRNDGEATLGDIFKLFEKKRAKYAKATRTLYEIYYAKYFKQYESVKYKKISGIFLQDIFDKIEKDSPYIAIICMKMCKSAANNAIKKGIIKQNKFNQVDSIKVPKADINHLTREELLQILEQAQKHHCKKYFTMLYTLVGTGIRIGELIALTKSDVNTNELYIDINKQFTQGELKDTKTTSSTRKVYIFPDLASCLADYIKELEGELLFPSYAGTYITIENFRRRFWTSVKKEVGITKRVRLHDLRGSYIDLVLASGISPKFAQNQVGHAKNSTTMDCYARNNLDMVRTATDTMGTFFNLGGKTVEKNEIEEKTNVISFCDRLAKRNSGR
jgi:integrase